MNLLNVYFRKTTIILFSMLAVVWNNLEGTLTHVLDEIARLQPPQLLKQRLHIWLRLRLQNLA